MTKLFLVWSAFLPLFLYGQSIVVSEEIPLLSDVAYEVLGEMGNHILLFRDGKTEFRIQAFNQQMRESWSKELELDKRSPKVLGIIPDGNYFTLIYSFRRKGYTQLKAHRYDAAANLVDSSLLVDLGYLFFTPNFELVRSEDRSKLLIYYPENQDMLRCYAFDLRSQELLWEQSFEPTNFIYNRDFVQALISNKGVMTYILERDNQRSKHKQHYYEIHTYDGAGTPISHNITMDYFLTYDVFFNYDNLNEQVVGAGLYAGDNLERAMGVFYLRYDPLAPDDTYTLNFTPFREAFLESLLGRNYREGKGLNEAEVQETVLRRDGGVILIVERNRQINRRTGVGAVPNVYYDAAGRLLIDFYFEEVLVVSIHPDGELHWETILYKKQYSQDDNGIYSSYFLFQTPGRLRFLFNDEIRHENTVSEYVINGLGEYERNSLFSTAKLDLKLRFRDAQQISAKSLVVPSERRNRLKLVRIDYP
ncbi:MAG: hypothetical protein D6772_14740 [Bacteroidetes bacterium]|nr:MAG: hypothetical protein D6772_14740 [Bacteroidota bacterium]